MATIGLYVGLILLGGVFGLSAALFWLWGYNARTRTDSGQRPFGSRAEIDEPVVNTDPEFVNDIRQDRLNKGLGTYVNEG